MGRRGQALGQPLSPLQDSSALECSLGVIIPPPDFLGTETALPRDLHSYFLPNAQEGPCPWEELTYRSRTRKGTLGQAGLPQSQLSTGACPSAAVRNNPESENLYPWPSVHDLGRKKPHHHSQHHQPPKEAAKWRNHMNDPENQEWRFSASE